MRAAQAVMADLATSGLTPEQLALVMELSAAVATEARPAMDKAAENKRAYDRDYRRARREENRTKSYDTNDIDDKGSPEVSPHTPLPKPSKITPLSPPKPRVELPDWMPACYGEFRAMRKSMRNVPFGDGAERRVIAKLTKLRAEGHDPEKLLSKAIERGHRTVFEDDTTRAKAAGTELSAQQLRERAEWYIRHGQPDRAEECRRKAIAIEQRVAA